MTGRLPAGISLSGDFVFEGERRWLRISEGRFAGGYVWDGNLSANEAVSSPESQTSDSGGYPAALGAGAIQTFSNGRIELTVIEETSYAGWSFDASGSRESAQIDWQRGAETIGRTVATQDSQGCRVSVTRKTVLNNSEYLFSDTLWSVRTISGCVFNYSGDYVLSSLVEEAPSAVKNTNLAASMDGMNTVGENAIQLCDDQAAAERAVRSLTAARYIDNAARSKEEVQGPGCSGDQVDGGLYQPDRATLVGSFLELDTVQGATELLFVNVTSIRTRLADGREVWGVTFGI